VQPQPEESFSDHPEPEALTSAISDYLGAAVERLRVLASGWETTLYEFALSARSDLLSDVDAGMPLVLRFYPSAAAAEKGAREYRIIRHLAASGYPVPRPLLFEPRPSAAGAPFMIMERLRGGPLFAIRSFPQAFKTFSLGFLAFVREQARLHRLALPNAALKDLSTIATPNPLTPLANQAAPTGDTAETSAAARLLERALTTVATRVEQGPLPGLAEAAACLQQRVAKFCDGPTSVVHMDYHPQNVLVEGTRVTGVIDWAGATTGDRHFDAATTSLILATSAMEHPVWMRDNAAGRNLRRTFCALYVALYHAIAPMEFKRLHFYQGLAGALRLSMLGMMLVRGPQSVGFRQGASAEVTPTVLRLLGRYVSRKSGALASVP
jgi:aminoglycoside phosphotransferase (APT) family kinase protein